VVISAIFIMRIRITFRLNEASCQGKTWFYKALLWFSVEYEEKKLFFNKAFSFFDILYFISIKEFQPM